MFLLINQDSFFSRGNKMVEDVVFYGVLIALIAFVAFFIVFMVWLNKKMPHPLLMKTLSTLHAAMFGYETALVELLGGRGYKTHVFPKIIETMRRLKDEDPLLMELFDAKTPKEAMEKWMDVLKLIGVTKNGQIIDKGNDEYEIQIPDCSLCNPIHQVIDIDTQKGICPMALILISASSLVETNKQPEIEYSEFMPTGTKTTLKLVEEKA